jgi:predicted signal transduction protein with EAL and GGDEF domain
MLLPQVVQVPAPPAPPEIPDWVFNRGPDPVEIAIAIAIIIAASGSLAILWVMVRGLVRKWSQPAANQQVVEELKHSVHQLAAEVTELQERLDFAERMLAAKREPERIERARGQG